MIPRYSRPEMSTIWSEETKFQIWFEIEAHACDAQAALGVIPVEAAKTVWEKGAFNIDRINEIERETKHDVIAFLTNLSEYVGPDARFIHQGMTSSDVLDTTLAVQMTRASNLMLEGIGRLLKALRVSTVILILLSGAVTGIPLLLFASSAKRIPLSILGILQYITPTIQFLLGVFAYSETFDSNRLIGYSIIWSGLVIFALDSFQFASNQTSHEK